MFKKIYLLLSIVFLLSINLFAQESFQVKVVGIIDGDTITVLHKDFHQTTVRLSGIDAPEKNQDFGQAAKDFLAKLIFEKKVTVITTKKDKYGRSIGKILLDGKDINLAMIEAGFAWHYKEYEDEQAENDREFYAAGEKVARIKLSGLWIQPNAVKPSDFRKNAKDENASVAPSYLPSGRINTPMVINPVAIDEPGSTVNASGTSGGSRTSTTSTGSGGNKTVHVDGYYRKNGTYVAPHTRSAPRRKN